MSSVRIDAAFQVEKGFQRDIKDRFYSSLATFFNIFQGGQNKLSLFLLRRNRTQIEQVEESPFMLFFSPIKSSSSDNGRWLRCDDDVHRITNLWGKIWKFSHTPFFRFRVVSFPVRPMWATLTRKGKYGFAVQFWAWDEIRVLPLTTLTLITRLGINTVGYVVVDVVKWC